MPLVTRVANVKAPLLLTVRFSVPLRSTSWPLSALTAPPIEYVVGSGVMQVTTMSVTLTVPTVPVPLATLQTCPCGCVETETEYGVPDRTLVANAHGPLARSGIRGHCAA